MHGMQVEGLVRTAQDTMRRLGLYLTSLIPAAMLLLALVGHRPYRYFVFLRLVGSIGAAVLALMAHKQNRGPWIREMLIL